MKIRYLFIKKLTIALIITVVFTIGSSRILINYVYGQSISECANVSRFSKELKHSNPKIREQAAYNLGYSGNRCAVPILLKAVADKNSSVRMAVAFSFGEISDKRAISSLVKKKHSIGKG